MSAPADPLVQVCAACGALIDVSEEEPLALMHCPSCGGAMRVRTRFGQFELLEVLGAGGMGAVYRAHDTTLHRALALKLLRREYSAHPEFLEQFDREAALTASISHPHVVKVYSTGSDHGLCYLAMELVDGGSLDDLMLAQPAVAEAQVLEIGLQVARGLQAALQAGLIHRDVKPGNILFDDRHQAKIVDFGLAAPLAGAGNVGGEVWGTPYYVAPEKLEQPPQEDLRSDLYSLGATLFHALTGKPPHDAQNASVPALRQLKKSPVALPRLRPELGSSTAYVLQRMLAWNPAERFQTYEELISNLEFALEELGEKTPAVGSGHAHHPHAIPSAGAGRPWLGAAVALGLALLAGAGWLALRPSQRAGGSATPVPAPARPDLAAPSEAARQRLLAGEFAPAAAEFGRLAELAPAASPLRPWLHLQAGLGELLADQPVAARAAWQKLSEIHPTTSDPVERELEDWLRALGQRLRADRPLSPEESRTLRTDNYQAIALLLYGLRAWTLGEIEEALPLLARFRQADPQPPDDWIAGYTKLVAPYEEAGRRYQSFAEAVGKVTTGPQAEAQLPALQQRLAALALSGPPQTKCLTLLQRVQALAEQAREERETALRTQEKNDERTLSETKTRADTLCAAFRFQEALAAARQTPVRSPRGETARRELAKRYEWLVTFKTRLVRDFALRPYPGGIIRRSGVLVPGEVSGADEQKLLVRLPQGSLTLLWTDLSFEGLVAMARFYLRPDLPPEVLADRLWTLGVFCVFCGRPREATPYFTQAVKTRPACAEEWKLFPEVPRS